MKAEYIKPFIHAAVEVLEPELGIDVTRGDLTTSNDAYTTEDITVLIGVTGGLEGSVLYGLEEETVKQIVSGLTGERQIIVDEFAESTIAEIGNIMSGRAMMMFEQKDIDCTISPPNVIVGRGTLISSMNSQRLQIPLQCELGTIHMAVSLWQK